MNDWYNLQSFRDYQTVNSRVSSMPIRLHRLSKYAFVLLLLTAMPVHAALNIEIFGGGATQIPIAIVPFAAEETLKQSITPVVGADLQRSGLFKLVDPGGLRPHEPVEVVYPDWMSRGAGALVIGSTTMLPG